MIRYDASSMSFGLMFNRPTMVAQTSDPSYSGGRQAGRQEIAGKRWSQKKNAGYVAQQKTHLLWARPWVYSQHHMLTSNGLGYHRL